MVLLVAVVWEEGQPVSWKYSLLHTILTSQLGEVRSLQHIASTCDAFQLYHLEPPLETIHWLTTLAIMIFSTVASTHRWFWYSQMTASKSNGHFLSRELQGQVDSRNQIRAIWVEQMSNSYVENMSSSRSGEIHGVSVTHLRFCWDTYFNLEKCKRLPIGGIIVTSHRRFNHSNAPEFRTVSNPTEV